MRGLDRLAILARIQHLVPRLSDFFTRQLSDRLEREYAAWCAGPADPRDPEWKLRAGLRLEELCRQERETLSKPLHLRLQDGERPLTREEILRLTAENAIGFDTQCKTELHDGKMYVDLSSLAGGEFVMARVERSWLPYLKRLYPFYLKHGSLYRRTFREINYRGERLPREVPLISVFAAFKYGQEYDSTFLTAYPRTGNHLDLTLENVIVPAMEASAHTAEMNEKLAERALPITKEAAEPVLDVETGGVRQPDKNPQVKPAGAVPDQQSIQRESATLSALDPLHWTPLRPWERAGATAPAPWERSGNTPA